MRHSGSPESEGAAMAMISARCMWRRVEQPPRLRPEVDSVADAQVSSRVTSVASRAVPLTVAFSTRQRNLLRFPLAEAAEEGRHAGGAGRHRQRVSDKSTGFR